MSDTATAVRERIESYLRMPRPLDCFTWNTTYGRLSSRDSALPGPWLGSSVPQLQHVHNLISARRLGRSFMGERDPYAHLTEQIWVVAAAQSMKTRSALYASLGHGVDAFPSPKALILPRLKDFKRILDNRVMPFFKETPQLNKLFPTGKNEYKKAITYQAWNLISCVIYMLCGEIADDLRSFPVCELFFDEFDLLPIDVENQGDPISLALERQKTFTRSKLALGVTTPGLVDGHGWRRLCSGSHERLFIQCPTCQADHELDWRHLQYPKDATADAIKLRRLATWKCPQCGWIMADDGTKNRLIAKAAAAHRWVPGKWEITGINPEGKWTPHADFTAEHRITTIPPAETVIRSIHLNGLYSQKITLSDFAYQETRARESGNAAELVTYENTWCTEPVMEKTISAVDMGALAKSATSYGYKFGTGPVNGHDVHLVLVLDQQGSSRASAWFPYIVRAFKDTGESWLIDAGEVEGFDAINILEQRQYQVGGESKSIEYSAMDGANGIMTIPIQTWSAAKRGMRTVLVGKFWPDFQWRERTVVRDLKRDRKKKSIVKGSRVVYFHANAYATELDSRMRALPGCFTWSLPDDAPPWYLASLTAEEQVMEDIRVPGKQSKSPHLVWKPRRVHNEKGDITEREDNHWWDCEKMSLVIQSIYRWEGARPPRRTVKYGHIRTVT